jgi:hypothetical protein
MSAKQLAKYVVALEAQTAKYQKGLEDARRRLGQFEKKNQVSLKAVGKSFLAVGTAVAAAGAAITAFAKKGIDAADQSIKAARTVGLTASQYEALSFAAQQSGVSVSSLNTSIQSFVRRLGEATQGGGQAADALSRLGLNAQTLAGLPTDVAMGKVADALQGVEGTAQRAQLAYQIFGRQGIELTRMLEGGSAALEAFRAESERFGVTLTGTQVKNVENATDAQGRLSTATRGLSMQLGATLAPAFTNAANAAANFLARITESVPRVAALASNVLGLKRSLDTLTIRDIEEEMRLVEQRALQLANAYQIVSERSRTLRDGTETEAKSLERLRAEIKQNQDAYEMLGKRMAALNASGDAQEIAAPAEPGEAMGASGRLRGVSLSESMKENIRELEDAQRRAAQVFSRTRTDVENYAEAVQSAIELLNRGLITPETFDRWVAQHAEGMTKIVEETEDAANQMSEFGAQAARSIQSAFANFLFDPFSGGLKGMLQGFSETLRRMAAEIVANKLLTSFLGRLAGSSNSFFSSIGESFTPRAMGGPVSAGGNYLVGERGPELFFPGVSGMIMPNHAIAGGAQIINNITVQAPEGRISRQSELQLRQSLASATNEGLRRAG